jgi:hypothetical protein
MLEDVFDYRINALSIGFATQEIKVPLPIRRDAAHLIEGVLRIVLLSAE